QSRRPRAAAAGERRLCGAARRRLREIPQGQFDRDHLSRIRQGQTQRYRQMISRVFQKSDEPLHDQPAQPDEYISPAPRVSVQTFCASVAIATAVRAASEDRRLGKAHLTVHMGGIAAAIDLYQKAPTPNVILIETDPDTDILDGLDELASVCDAGTRVVVVG